AGAALLAFLLGHSSSVGPALARLMPRADGAWRRTEGLAISGALLVVGTTLVTILVGRVGLETLTESEYVRGFEATDVLGCVAGGVMMSQVGIVDYYIT